ncbi:MAG: phosphodiester glycosidase family protein [Solobacterium sp.]|nr:phosphodiester glycosidase family protein [Solobacterium sp.]
MILFLTTILLFILALAGIIFILVKGPSTTARNLFVHSVKETSAIGFLANMYLSDAEVEAILNEKTEIVYEETDTSLVTIKKIEEKEEDNQNEADAWGLVDDDGDGIIVEPIKGAGYKGYLMVVLDPSRVKLGSVPESYGKQGYTVDHMIEHYGAIAGINAGGFLDPGGMGDGSTPDSLVVVDGQIYYEEFGYRDGFVGFDQNHVMHVGLLTGDDIRARGIQTGVCFGPVLIHNGTPVDASALPSGVNPRTAIGQRSDGAVLLLVIDGRQATSLGARYQDLADIMYKYGAVNALNLDGGSSSLMYYKGEYINSSASVLGIRDMPTAWLVMPKEGE